MAEQQKERFEVLLEDIKSKVNLIAEGHSLLDNKLEEVRRDLKNEIRTVDAKVDNLGKRLEIVHDSLKKEITFTGHAVKDELRAEIGRVERKIDEHIRQPVHA